MQRNQVVELLRKVTLGASLLTAGMMFTGVARADAYDHCQKKLIHADHELHEAIERHGYESRQADHWRHELREAREWCWEHRHRWWSED